MEDFKQRMPWKRVLFFDNFSNQTNHYPIATFHSGKCRPLVEKKMWLQHWDILGWSWKTYLMLDLIRLRWRTAMKFHGHIPSWEAILFTYLLQMLLHHLPDLSSVRYILPQIPNSYLKTYVFKSFFKAKTKISLPILGARRLCRECLPLCPFLLHLTRGGET